MGWKASADRSSLIQGPEITLQNIFTQNFREEMGSLPTARPQWEPLLSQKRETILDTDEAASAEAGIHSIITFIAAAYLAVPASHRSFKPVRTRNKVL